MGPWSSRPDSAPETLEVRIVLSTLSVGATTNTGHIAGSQSETAIAINPTNPNNIVALANENAIFPGDYESISNDGGKTWSAFDIETQAGGALPTSGGDGTLAFDSYGNLYQGYLESNDNTAAVAVSTDGGKTFTLLGTAPSQDQPKVATGPGHTPGTQSMWMEFLGQDGQIAAIGVESTGLGKFGTVTQPKIAPGSQSDNFGKLSVGPQGQVLMSYQDNIGSGGPSSIFVSLDPTGIGGSFQTAVTASSTNVGGFDYISPQTQRSVDAEAGLAYDIDPKSVHYGRVYLIYTDAGALGQGTPGGNPTAAQNDTNIELRYSDDDGKTWTAPTQVNDDKTMLSQFFPRVAVDPTSGVVAMSWLDARNDPTDFSVEPYATVSLDGGQTIQPNVQVWNSPSNATTAPDDGNNTNDFGDYTGLSFYGGVFFPIWPDNSAALPGNTDSPHLDIATAPVTVETLTVTALPIAATEGTQFNGQVATFTPSGVNVPISAFTATINWGDGTANTPGTIVAAAGAGGTTYEVFGSHTYAVGGPYVITVTVVQSGTTAANTSPATVVGLPINAVGESSIALQEGDSYAGLLAHFTDTSPAPHPASFYSATINFGDGSTGIGTITADPAGGFNVTDGSGHLYGGGTDTITVTINKPGFSATATTTAFVRDSPLTSTGFEITPIEGFPYTGVLAAFSDADPRHPPAGNYYATIDYGDGTPPVAGRIVPYNGTGTTSGGSKDSTPYRFAVVGDKAFNAQPYTITVTIGNFSGGNTTVAITTANVIPATLTAQSYNIAPVAGQTFSAFVASFLDADPRAQPTSFFTATVDWGDGTTTPGQVIINTDGGYLVRASHAYMPGTFTVTTTILDNSGASVVTTGTATVASGPISLVVAPVAPGPQQGVAFNGQLATFTTANLLSHPGDYSAQVNWGDGTTSAAAITGGDGAFVILADEKIYSQPGTFPITIVVTSPDGMVQQGGGSLTVSGAAIAVSPVAISGTAKTPLSGLIVATFTSSNPGALASDYSATINWGDGTTTAGTIVGSSPATFQVDGNHTYTEGGAYPVTVTITGGVGPVAVATTATIADLLTTLTGSVSGGGSSAVASTGLTNTSTPTFTGHAAAFAQVRVLAQPIGGSASVVGTGQADGSGNFSITSTALADGQYIIMGSATDQAGQPSSTLTVLYPTASHGVLTVDTQGPKVASATFDPAGGKVTIVFTDGLSGLLLAGGLLDASHFSLSTTTGQTFAITGLTATPVNPQTQETVTLTFAHAGRSMKAGKYLLQINSAGVTDNAGNGLDERYFVPFPGLYNKAGQNYVAAFSTNGKTSSAAEQYVPPAEVTAAAKHRLFVRKHFRH